MLGYAPLVKESIIITRKSISNSSFRLSPVSIDMPALIISASKRPRSFVDAPTSVTILNAADLEQDNSITLDESLDYVPGIHMVGSQINIRGSSGFSRGVGSRVLMLMDGFPSLSADNGDIKWDAIPIDQIERVEIIKGAGSALYGTGALGGIINVITRTPAKNPITRLRMMAGFFSRPNFSEWEWSGPRRSLQGFDLSHSRTEGKLGVILALGQKWSNGYRENSWYKRYNGFGKFTYEFDPTSKLAGSANWAWDDHGVFIQWKDRNEPLEVPVQRRADQTLSRKLNLNLAYNRMISTKIAYRVKSFVYRTDFDNEVEGNSGSTAYKLGQEIQLDLQPFPTWSLTWGGEWQADRVRSSDNLFGSHRAYTLAAYGQSELDLANFLISIGTRFDRHDTDSTSVGYSVSPKAAIAWKISRSTSVKSIVGWGFRGPSIAELYTSAEFSGIPIQPNPGLRPEQSRSWEFGISHVGSNFAFEASAFWSHYSDLIEARPDATTVVRFGNVASGRILGLETHLKMGIDPVTIDGTYTYMDASESLSTGRIPLPYRPNHIASAGLLASIHPFELETRLTYRGRILRASGLFPEGVRDLISVYLVDVAATFKSWKIENTLKVHNLLEYNYAEIERNLAPPRRLTLSLGTKF